MLVQIGNSSAKLMNKTIQKEEYIYIYNHVYGQLIDIYY